MSLLLPDYSSSSSDDEAAAPAAAAASPPRALAAPPRAATDAPASACVTSQPHAKTAVMTTTTTTTTTKKKKKKKAPVKKVKAAMFLPPEIQRLLESGGADASSSDSEDDGGSELLAKRRQARRLATAAKRQRVASEASLSDSAPRAAALSFLPPPRYTAEEETAAATAEGEASAVDEELRETRHPQVESEQQAPELAPAAAHEQMPPFVGGWSPSSGGYGYTDAAAEDSGKSARRRERELERALQQGQLPGHALGRIAEVAGPSPGAWRPAIDPGAEAAADGEVKVRASFWSTQQGARVATAKPSRLQRQRHQLNQLAFDAKARETELLDRKGAGLKTKRETYAKYGW